MKRGAVDASALASAVSRHRGAVHTVAELTRLSGGASRETWRFDAVGPDGDVSPLILRRDPPPEAVMTPLVDEYALIEVAGAAGVPVAPLEFRLEPADDLGAGFVAGFVDGETLGKPIVHDPSYASARSSMVADLGRTLAALHSVSPDSTPLESSSASSALGQIGLFEKMLDGFDVARPVFELAMRWLRENAPSGDRQVVVHGDFRIGNLIVDNSGVRAVLDWELAHIGNPGEDIGWLCTRSWRFGGSGRVGGVGDLDDLLAAYEEAGGIRIGANEVRYWEVMGNLRWGVIAMAQAFSHLSGSRRSVEMAAIGRRAVEVEYDLMELLS